MGVIFHSILYILDVIYSINYIKNLLITGFILNFVQLIVE